MSFKIPKGLEFLDLTPIDSVDKIQKGDLIVIPDEKSAPKLRVTLGTLRSWGLSVTSDDRHTRYGCANYSAAVRAFGTPCTMSGAAETDAKSHVYVVGDASHDKNSAFGKKAEAKITIENANSISDSKVIVEQPVYPLMSAKVYPMDPLFPTESHVGHDDYPESFTNSVDIGAYRMLIEKIGKKSIPTMSSFSASIEQDGYENLPYFLSAVSAICAERPSEYDATLGGGSLLSVGTSGYYGRRYDDAPRAAELIITAPGLHDDAETHKSHATSYFHNDAYKVNELSMEMPKKFIENIVKRGALLYRSDKVHDLVSRIMASCVARNMEHRYDVLLSKMKNLLNGLSQELPKVEKIRDNYKKATADLSISPELEKLIRKLF